MVKEKGDIILRNLQIIQNIKSYLLDFWIAHVDQSLTDTEYLHEFQMIAKQEFKMKKVEYLKLEHGLLCPLPNSTLQAIPFNSIATYVEETHPLSDTSAKLINKVLKIDSDAIILKDEKDNIFALIIVENTPEWQCFASTPYVKELETLLSTLILSLISKEKNFYEAKLNRELYEMTAIFHSTMNINTILEAMIQSIKRTFPQFKSKLILSNDQDRLQIEDVEVFDYLLERPSTIEAYVSGEITSEEAKDINNYLLNVPIIGKQGIYGVLQIFASPNYHFSSKEKKFLSHLAQTSGNALENAKLYHQSHRLVADLQLINETSQRLNMKLNKDEIITFLTMQLKKSFLPSEICFVFKSHDGYQYMGDTAAFFCEENASVYKEFIATHFEKSMEPLFIAEFSQVVAEKTRYNSMIVVPIIINEKVQGYCAIFHVDSYYFSFDSYKLMQSLIRHSSLAISNILLREQLQEMIDRDHLTTLYARKYLERYIEHSMEVDDFGAFILCDIDDFKKINDTYGHQTGDVTLLMIAKHLQSLVENQGICARWGGEEMAIYLPNKGLDETMALVGKIINSIPKVTSPPVTISSGIALWRSDARFTYQRVFKNADVALYEAKNTGKNKYCIFQGPNINEKADA